MQQSIYTNPDLLKYWALMRGDELTSLTLQQIMSLGSFVLAFDMMPKDSNGYHWTDGLIDFDLDGYRYISFPDLVDKSVPAFTEEKGISNSSINFKLSGVDNAVRVLALGGFLKDARVNIRLVILNPYDSTVLDSQLLFSGYIDYFQLTVDPNDSKNEMTVYLNSIYKKLDLATPTLAANSVYQSFYPGDSFFSLLGQVNMNQTWRYDD